VSNAEVVRFNESRSGLSPWKKWGPCLSERQWGTVREDYSHTGTLHGERSRFEGVASASRTKSLIKRRLRARYTLQSWSRGARALLLTTECP
jgi:hypothetical protein